MAYETGTASGPADLINNRLTAFAIAQGWTVTTLADGNKSIHKGDAYFSFLPGTDYIFIHGNTSVDAGANWDAQPGKNTHYAAVSNCAGPFIAYHFFAGADYIHCVIEVSAGVFSNFSFGTLEKAGTYTGGQYFAATRWYDNANYRNYPNTGYHAVMFDSTSTTYNRSGAVRADGVQGRTWHHNCYDNASGSLTNESKGTVRQNSIWGQSHNLAMKSPSTFNNGTPLVPIMIFISDSDYKATLAGRPQDIRAVNMQNLAPGETITLGADEWMVFPIRAKTDTWNINNGPDSSGYYGFAFKKTA